jgi:2-polyprenyl-3-methyl-5-hydroxy-6-metoxy-1,4-benzoquinol methylase
MEGQYSGVDVLEALEGAHNYNDYLTRLIRQSTESRDLIDFGAGIGTFSKRLRTAGYYVTCIEPDPLQRQKLQEQGFDSFDSIASIPNDSASFIFSLNVFEHLEQHAIAVSRGSPKIKTRSRSSNLCSCF